MGLEQMRSYPVQFDAVRPLHFDRVQIAVRVLLFVILGFVGASLGWLFVLLYLGLPALAASFVSTRGAERYLAEIGPRVMRALRWVLAVYAYLSLVTDRLPIDTDAGVVLEIEAGVDAHPT